MLLVLAMLMVTGSVYGVVEASYDGGEELILIERYPIKHKDVKYSGLSQYPINIELYSIYWNPKYFDSLLRPYYSEDRYGLIYINDISYDDKSIRYYSSIGRDPIYENEPIRCHPSIRKEPHIAKTYNITNQQYYYVKDGSRLIKTNNIRYKLDPTKEQEKTLADFPLDDELLYAGYISSNERLYIHRTTKEQYIKVLEPIIDPVIVFFYIMDSSRGTEIFYQDLFHKRAGERSSKNGSYRRLEENEIRLDQGGDPWEIFGD
ncbi:MAG: hypothetical protein ACRCWI_01750 [Brevinema sp.]